MANLPEHRSPSASESGSQQDERHAVWIAGRIQTLLNHYFQPDNPADVTEAALDDWVDMLGPFSQPAIEHACASYLRDQPRRRPSPGDITARAETFDRDGERRKYAASLSAEEARAVEWAVMTGRMGREAATQAVQSRIEVPEWCNSEAQAAVYRIRHHPNCMTPDDGGVAQYRKMVRA